MSTALTICKPNVVADVLKSEAFAKKVEQRLPRAMCQAVPRLLAMAASQIRNNTYLQQCTVLSLQESIMKAAESGLLLDGFEAYLVPRRNHGTWEMAFQASYKGMVKLCYQSGLLTSIYADVVCENDVFEYEYGLNQRLVHKPADGPRGAMKYAYCVARIKDGEQVFRVLSKERVMEHKAKSDAATKSFSPWNQPMNEAAMWMKTAFRELSAWIPRSTSMQAAMVHDMAEEIGGRVDDDGVLYASATPIQSPNGALESALDCEPEESTSQVDPVVEKIAGQETVPAAWRSILIDNKAKAATWSDEDVKKVKAKKVYCLGDWDSLSDAEKESLRLLPQQVQKMNDIVDALANGQ